MFYLTVSAVKKIHDWIIESQGGVADGVRPPQEGNIYAAVERPKTRLTSENPDKPFVPFDGLLAKATALGYSLNQGHGFTDGNKRTALMSMWTMLYLNGVELTLPPIMAKYSILVADDKMTEEEYLTVVKRYASSSRLGVWWKTIRYSTVPEIFYNVLYYFPGTYRFAHRTDLDWFGAGSEEALDKFFAEAEKWEAQGYPKEVELKIAETIEGMILDGDVSLERP